MINKLTKTMKSVIFDNELFEKINAMAKENKRSFSAQVVYMLEQYLKV